MLNIDLMSEQEIIELIHDEKKLAEIIQGKLIVFCENEEQTLELSHLFARISPLHQDNDEFINITKISNLMFENIKPYIKDTTNNTYEDNLKVCKEVYSPLIRLINKLSIKRAKELVYTSNIKQLLINPKINTGITYTALSWIDKPSVLKILNNYLDTEIAKSKIEKKNIQSIKLILKDTIKQHKTSLAIKRHFETECQRITDKETNQKKIYAYYQSTKGMINHIMATKITNSEEQKAEKQTQEDIEFNESYSKQIHAQYLKPKRK